jgi:hypothetical protein
LKTSTMIAALVTALTACASGAGGGAPDVRPIPGAPGSLTIAPASIEVATGGTAQFTVTDGAEVVPVVWSLDDASGGTVTAAGLFTASDVPGNYELIATSADAKQTAATVTVTATPVVVRGTGARFTPSYVTGAGGGPMPAWTGSGAVTARCAGDGSTDDTACLQAAAGAARDQGKVLAIPATSAFYRITGPVTVWTSVGGVGGTPRIVQTNQSATWGAQKMLIVAAPMTGWIYNLHLVGTFNGSNAVTEHGHQIDVGNVNGVTISGNLLENAMGDAVSSDISQYDGPGASGLSQNVLVDGNTMRNPYRCGVAFIHNQRGWAVVNNLIEKPVNFVSGVGIEPELAGVVIGVEVAYNKFVMNNRTVNPSRGADGIAVYGWHVPNPPTPTAGGDYWLHHNYGTFGTGFSGFGNGGWGAIYQASNVEGQSVPQ